MRLATLQTPEGPAVVRVEGEMGVKVPGLSMLELIALGPAGLERAAAADGPRIRLAPEDFLAPIPSPPRNVMAIGRNYAEHVREGAAVRGAVAKMPTHPVFFTKATRTVNGPYAPIPFDARVSTEIDWEAELAVVIGRRVKNLAREESLHAVFGYAVLNDVTARDLQNQHNQFFKGKSLDGFCPWGPWIVTADEVPDPGRLRVICRVNGVVKQDGNTADWLFDLPTVLASLANGMTLEPGDLLATGTPSGVGFARTPPEFLRPGDVVETEVEGLGLLRNPVVAV